MGKKIVWVLGAGFSAGLGGPLLTRLLSENAGHEIDARYPKSEFPELHTEPARNVRRAYELGLSDASLRSPRINPQASQSIWANAEDFLDYLDTAADVDPDHGKPHPNAKRLGQFLQGFSINHTLDELRVAARRIIAAECSAFLKDVNPLREQWQPYRDWARTLNEDDTIITFNYDRVLETIIAFQEKRDLPTRLHVVIPGVDIGETGDGERWAKRCPVLKLHGSVDWRIVDRKKKIVEVGDEHFALLGKHEELAIATPGPSKKRTAADFGDLWKLAEAKLKEASAVVFVGYRFPETDADARSHLLGAIRANKNATNPNVHIVLGPKSKDASERLRQLIRFVFIQRAVDWQNSNSTPGVPNFNPRSVQHDIPVSDHALYSQDFFSVVLRETL